MLGYFLNFFILYKVFLVRIKYYLIIIIIFSTTSYASELNYKNLIKTLDKGLYFFEEKESLPKRKLFGRDQESAQNDLDKILDATVSLMSNTVVLEYFYEIKKIDVRIEKKLEETFELQTGMLNSRSFEEINLIRRNIPFLKEISKEEYIEKIDGLKSTVEDLEKEKSSLIFELRNKLADTGISLSYSDLILIIYNDNADLNLKLLAIAHSAISLKMNLDELIIKDARSVSNYKNFFRYFLIVFMAIDKTYSELIYYIEKEQLPFLLEVKKQATENIKSARTEIRLQRKNESVVSNLNANIKSNNLTIKTVDFYTSLLNQELARNNRAREELRNNYRVTLNTYKTIGVQSSLSGFSISDIFGGDSFKTIAFFSVPEPITFTDSSMEQEFKQLRFIINRDLN
jgi:hypothetical protein